MRTNEQMLSELEERSMGWTWDTRIPALVTALGMIESLPREMKDQEELLSSMLMKAELYGRFREALAGLTSNMIHLRLEAPESISNVTVPSEPRAGVKDAAIDRLINEMCRLGKEFDNSKIDYAGVMRFLRIQLKK